jgi:type IV secretion system protein VirB9
MPCAPFTIAAACLVAWSGAVSAQVGGTRQDPRLREVRYDPGVVVTVPVKRGAVTLVVLDSSEAITEMGSGHGADCSKPDTSWCIAAQPGGRHIFIKPKSNAAAATNLVVVTDRRSHAFRFVVLADGDAREPVYRLAIKTEQRPPPAVASTGPAPLSSSPATEAAAPQFQAPSTAELIAHRLSAAPTLVNSAYSLAEGSNSEDILPALIFDDGRFTYFRFPNNREVPAVFHVLGDGSETLVNTRMEGDLLVVDRVSRRLMLRAGAAVVGVWNDAFDIDGVPPSEGTTIAGVRRLVKGAATGNGEDQDTGSQR